MRKKKEIRTIGRLEKVSLPEIGLSNVDAKIDTGAYTSSMHCVSIEEQIEGQKHILVVSFSKKTTDTTDSLKVTFYSFSKTRVRSSSGKLEKRYKIKTSIKLGNKFFKTDLTLTNRSKMKYLVLIGRKLLNKRFIVDVSKKNTL